MDAKFINWVMEKLDRADTEEENQKRLDFLRTLKFEPDRVRQWISNNIHDWGMAYMVCTEAEMLQLNFDSDSLELFLAVQKRFAKDLGIITR